MLTRQALDEAFQVELPLFKARAETEGEHRYVYCEPSNEAWDSDDERVMQEALAASAEHYLKFGNLDIWHLTVIGLMQGRNDFLEFEIGKPCVVIAGGKKFWADELRNIHIETGSQYEGVPVMVKGEIYRGDGPSTRHANFFWSTLTQQDPKQDWYPSIGGRRAAKVEHDDGRKTVVAVKWVNIGFWKEPVNELVRPATTIAPADFLKAVTAGYGTDVAQLTGGQALHRQSLEGRVIDHRPAAGRFLKALGGSACVHTQGDPTLAKMVAHFRDCEGLDEESALATVESMVAELAHRLKDASEPAAIAA